MLNCRIFGRHVSRKSERLKTACKFGITIKPDMSVERIVASPVRPKPPGFEYGWLFDSHILWLEPYPLLTLMATNTQAHAARDLRDQSGGSRHHSDLQPVCHPKSDLRRPHGTWHRPWRQFAPRAGQEAGQLVATRSEAVETFRDLTAGREIAI